MDLRKTDGALDAAVQKAAGEREAVMMRRADDMDQRRQEQVQAQKRIIERLQKRNAELTRENTRLRALLPDGEVSA